MSDSTTAHDYLVLSRGQWDESLPQERIQQAIDGFYAWYEQALAAGTMKPGQRLAREGKLVSRQSVVDGPFTEAREIIGGYWFIVAGSLDEAAAIAASNPCVACGLELEIRPLELERASAYAQANETPKATDSMKDIRHVVIHSPGPQWQPGKSLFEQAGLQEHVEHYRQLLQAGKLALGGPHLDAKGGGMMVPTAGVTEDEIARFAAEDPAVKSGLLIADVRPWLIGMSP